MKAQGGLEGEDARDCLIDPLLAQAAVGDGLDEPHEVAIGIVAEQDDVAAGNDHFGQHAIARAPIAHASHGRGVRDDEPVKAQLAPQQVLVEHPAEGSGAIGLGASVGIEGAHEGGQRDMGRHDAEHARIDRLAIEAAKTLLPLGHGQRIDRGHQMLVAVVIAFAGPVLDGGGNAIGLEGGDLGQGVALDLVDVAAIGAGADNGAAPGGVDVDDRGEAPVEPHGLGFARHDGGNGAGGLDIVDGGQTQRIGHAGAEGQAHAAAFEIGADQQGHRAQGREVAGQRDFGAKVIGIDAGDAARLEAAYLFGDVVRGAALEQHEELGQLVARGKAIAGGMHPGDSVVIEIERGSGEIDASHGGLLRAVFLLGEDLAEVAPIQ